MIWTKFKTTATICLGMLIATGTAILEVKPNLGIASGKVDYSKESGFQYVVDDFEVYPIPNIPKPAKGKPIKDPTFNTEIVRITDREEDRLVTWRGNIVRMAINEYARIDPENCSGTKGLVMCDGGKWYVYDLTNYRMIVDTYKEARGKEKKLLAGAIEPRWDRYNPNVFYFRYLSRLYKYDVSNMSIKKLRDFKKDFGENIVSVRNKYEGSPSFDSRYWAFRGDGGRNHNYRTLVWAWYDLKKNEILASLKNPLGSDNVTMSMLGDLFCAGSTRGQVGYKLKDLTTGRVTTQLAPTTGHADLAINAEGREVMVYENSKNDWIEMTFLDTGETVKLISITHKTNWNEMRKGGAGMHISGNSIATPGWALISWYGGAPYKPYAWQHQSIFMLELKENPRVWRIAHTHCPWATASAKDYWAEAFAAINTAGTKVYWGSNWDVAEKKTRTLETYCAKLPETWYSDLMGEENAKIARAVTRKQIEEKLGKEAAEAYDKLLARSAG